MADIIDDSQELQEAQIAAALAKRMKVPEKTGLCLACDEPVSAGVFCDADCREFYERTERIREIKGKSK